MTYYVVTIPTYPTPTLSRTAGGKVRRFATRERALAHAARMGVPANVERRREGTA